MQNLNQTTYNTGRGWKGENYSLALSTKEIAKILRKEIKAILPKGAKLSITSEYKYLRIRLTKWNGPLFTEAYKKYLKDEANIGFQEHKQSEIYMEKVNQLFSYS